jgi:hypothetical protein
MWPTEIHKQLIETAFRSKLSPADIAILEQVSAQQDSFWLGCQAADVSYQHAMRDGVAGQSVADAVVQYTNFLA